MASTVGLPCQRSARASERQDERPGHEVVGDRHLLQRKLVIDPTA
jgi:hypothetical protein